MRTSELKKCRKHTINSKKSWNSPMVGMVVTISPSFSLYRMVVLPAASSPTCRHKHQVRFIPTCNGQLHAMLRKNSYHENAHLLLGEEAGKQLCKSQPHLEAAFPATPLHTVCQQPGFFGAHCRAVCLNCALWNGVSQILTQHSRF